MTVRTPSADTSKARLLGVRHSLAEAEHFSICLIGKSSVIRHFSPYTTFDRSSLIAPHVVILLRDRQSAVSWPAIILVDLGVFLILTADRRDPAHSSALIVRDAQSFPRADEVPRDVVKTSSLCAEQGPSACCPRRKPPHRLPCGSRKCGGPS
jgi:hypothetical protein